MLDMESNYSLQCREKERTSTLIKVQNSWHTSESLSWAFSSFNWFNSASNSTVYACKSKRKPLDPMVKDKKSNHFCI